MAPISFVSRAGKRFTARAFGVLWAALVLGLLAGPSAAQGNSPEATAAARQHRAEVPGKRASGPAAKAVVPAPRSGSTAANAASQPAAASRANPNWAAELAQCKSEAGMNLYKRERCVFSNCKGHWGEGECPPGRDVPNKDSFKNPFKRDAKPA